jgi:hypothetical protein
MRLPTRCCYVKAQEKEAVRITSLKVPEPKVDPTELATVLSEYQRRYQRNEHQAKAALKDVADALFFRGFPGSQAGPAATAAAAQGETDAPAEETDRFHNPFTKHASRKRKN